MCELADAGACVRVRMCLCVPERTRACVGAHAFALEGAGSRTYGCVGVRACLPLLCMYDLPYSTIDRTIMTIMYPSLKATLAASPYNQ